LYTDGEYFIKKTCLVFIIFISNIENNDNEVVLYGHETSVFGCFLTGELVLAQEESK
tara:strand:- start:2939 stop:3109 length:171 start_codon:yes stop_codon:yes gene_type:complete